MPPTLSKEAFTMLENYYWPGNVRELENAIERAVILCNGTIEIEHLPDRLKKNNSSKLPEQSQAKTNSLEIKTLKEAEIITISNALREAKGNITLAAKYLDISRTTLYKRINDMKLDIESKYTETGGAQLY